MWQDLRFAIRSLVKRPAFTAVALIALALGIGANTAIFSVVNAVLLRPLPYDESDRLVKITSAERRQQGGGTYTNISIPDFLDFNHDNSTFESMAALSSVDASTILGRGQPERIKVGRVTEDFFRVLHMSPRLGRTFTHDEDTTIGARVVILTHGLWQARFGGDREIIGRQINLSARPTTVIGVLPASFKHAEMDPAGEPAAYVPMRINLDDMSRSGRFVRAIGRLKAAVAVDSAQADLSTIAARLELRYPTENHGVGVHVMPLIESVVGSTRTALTVLLGAVGLVLLIACANIANLLMANAAVRRHEMAVRIALGAGRRRLIRQLLTESLVLGLLGTALGLFVARLGAQALVALNAGSIPRADEVSLNWRVLVFSLGLAWLTSVLFGLVPALQLSNPSVQPSLRAGGRGGDEGRSGHAFRRMLVASEVALSMVLLVGASLLMKSFWRLAHVDPGFRPEQVLSLEVSVPTATYAEGDQIPFYRTLYERVAPLPGVRAVGATNILPLGGNYSCDGFQVDERPVPEGQQPCAEARSVSPNYFRAMGIPLIKGRGFSSEDREGRPRVVMINQKMAQQFWPGGDPVGKTMTYTSRGQGDSREIVGVVGNVKHFGLDQESVAEFYTPQAQQPSFHTMMLIVRAESDPVMLTDAIRRQVAEIDKDVPLSEIRTLESVKASSVAQPRFRTVLLGLFAAIALLLAVVGVYGVIAYSVSQRTREIGVRMALGAEPGQVVTLLVRQGIVPVLAGIGIGVIGALALSRAISSLLFGVTATDPLTFLALPVLIAAIAVAASYVPARRATRVSPVAALRGD